MDALIGKRLGGKYEIQAEIGRGGMGVVYRGYDVALQRPVAVKVLPASMSFDREFVQRFQREAVLAARLVHPHIVTIHDIGTDGDLHYIVMEYLRGETLDQWLQQYRRMPVEMAMGIVAQIAQALDYAHAQQIIHRDIKPANVMLSSDGRVKLMDFGLVRAVESSNLTRSGVIVGTPEYMSPEQALGSKIDHRSDVYSLGVVVYKLLSGRGPFERSTPYAITYGHVHEPPPPLRSINPDVSPAVESVILKALAKKPSDRYDSAGEMVRALALAAGQIPVEAEAGRRFARPASEPLTVAAARSASVPASRPQQIPRLAMLAGIALAVLAVIAVIMLAQGSDSPGALPPPSEVSVLPSSTATSPPAGQDGVPSGGAVVGTPLPSSSSAPSVPEALVSGGDVVNVRSGPGVAHTTAGQVRRGESYRVVGANQDQSWWQICCVNGAAVWIDAKLVDVVAGSIASATVPVIRDVSAIDMPLITPTPLPLGAMKALYNQEGRFNVRMGPGFNYPVVALVDAGTVFTVTGRNEDALWLEAEERPGETVWILAELVELNYPAEAAAVVKATPVPPTEYVVADSVADFSTKQGDKRWFYVASKAPGSLQFDSIPLEGGWYRWTAGGRNPQMRLSAEGSYPSWNSDAMRLWVSFYQGELRIEGSARKERGAGYGGNGVVLRIVQRRPSNDQTAGFERELWYSTLGPYDTSGFTFTVPPFEVELRDEIYFITSADGDDREDNTVFKARVVLMNEGGTVLPPTATPTAAPTATPVPPLCFEPRLRHFEEHKGCCGEVVGIAYTNNGRLSWGSVHIEGPPSDNQYRRDFGIAADGGYEITALSAFPSETIYYTVWLTGPRIRSGKYEVRYTDAGRIRAVLDFYQVPCR